MTVMDRTELRARIGKNADYYLRRFEEIDLGRKAGWNWPAFFLSTAWFSYRRLGGWAALNLVAPWLTLVLLGLKSMVVVILDMTILVVYLVVFFILVPIYADALYYRRLKKELARPPDPGSRPSSPTRPVSATLFGVTTVALPVLSVAIVVPLGWVDSTARAQASEAIALMGSAKTPIAEYFADKGKWPDNLKQVAEHTSGRNTDRIEITSGAGASSGALVMTATMKASGVNSAIAGKTVQMRSDDGGKTWICRRGAVNGVEEKNLPAACRP